MKYRYLSIFLVLLIISIGAVSAQENTTSDDVIGIMQDDTILSSSDYAIDDSNYDTYFNSTTGKILENSNISDGDTIKIGNVSDKMFTIDKNLIITSNSTDSVAVNTTFVFDGVNGSSISDLTIKNDELSAIYVKSSDTVNIENNVIQVTGAFDTDAFAIYADLADNLNVNANVISYVGKTNGTGINNAIRVSKSEGVAITENNLQINVPAGDLDWSTGFGVSEGVVLIDCAESVIADNEIALNTTESVGNYSSVYAVHVGGSSDDVRVIGNEIVALGNTSYLYGLNVGCGFFVVAENNITVSNELNYAAGIEIAAPADVEISGNTIDVYAPNSAYGIYAADWNGVGCSVNITDNKIEALANTVFDVSLFGVSNALIEGNEIEAVGNYTTGIASNAKVLVVNDNSFDLSASDVGTPLGFDSFGINSVAISALSGNVTIASNNITSSFGTLRNGIIINESEVCITENNIDVVDTGLADSYGILVSNSNNVEITNNKLNYTGKTNGSLVNNAMYVADSAINEVSGNNFNITIPSAPVNWLVTPPIATSEGIVFNNDTGLNFKDNKIDLTASEAVGDYDTVYVIDSNCDDAVISGNDVFANGKSYIYGLIISGENLNVSNNDITSISDTYYANAIDVEGPASGSFDNNNFTAISPVVAYGVYSSMSGSDVNATYTNNNILCVADIVYGMELAGNDETVAENTIEVYGNKTMGIAGKSSTLNIANNEINALGKNLGNTTTWDSFEPETVGVKIIGGNATVYGNNIKSNGTSAVNVTTTDASVTYNYLICNNSFGDASVYFDGNATVHDNLPDYDAFLETEDVVMYYKNGTRFTANLVNFYGEPLENMTITFTINGVDYNRTTNENGTASIAINLPSGEYEVITTFDPGYNKTPTVNSNSLTVLTTVFGDDLVKVYRNESQYYATFVDGQGNPLASGTEVKFNINGVWYNRKISENGTAKLNINLPQGEYIITAVNPENGEMHTNNITVLSSITDNADLVKYYKNDSQYVVTVLGSDGNPVGAGENVTFNINGVMYTRQTNASGQAKLNINLQPGNYTITAEYNGCKVSNNIEVLPVLRANDLVKKYGVSDQFIAYLVDGQGKPFEGQNVTFNINGVFYNRLTDSDGRAILNIKLGAAMDTYIITSSYNGSSISNKISIIP